MTKTLIILGAGIDQLPAYREARARGLYVIAFDSNPEAPGRELADEFWAISTRDPYAILPAIGDRKIDGVIGPASDASQVAVFVLSRYFKTPFQPTHDAVMASIDKAFFLEQLERWGLRVHDFYQSRDLSELATFTTSRPLPLVIKPADGSGSKGISIVRERAAIDQALAEARRHSFSGEVIVEEYLEGRHLSSEAFFKEDELVFLATSEKELGGANAVITTSHLMPARLPEAQSLELENYAKQVARMLGIANGPVNFDWIVLPCGAVHCVEVGARLAGNGMAMVVREAFGVDLIAAATSLALGEDFQIQTTTVRVAKLKILHADQDGRVTAAAGTDALEAVEGVVSAELVLTPGQVVRRLTQSADKLGYLLISGESYAAVDRTLEAAAPLLSLAITPHSSGDRHVS